MSAVPSPAMRAFEEQWQKRTPDALEELRAAAMQRFVALGLPTARDESWRYTNLRALESQFFGTPGPLATRDKRSPYGMKLLLDPKHMPAMQIGNGEPDLPARSTSFAGIEVHGLQALAASHPERIARLLRVPGDEDLQRWDLLNTALFSDGLLIKINRESEARLCLVHVTTATRSGEVSYPRVIIEAAPGSRATIIEQHVDGGTHATMCNACTQVQLAAGAHLEHYRVFSGSDASTHFNSLVIVQDQNSSCRQFTVALGGGLVRATVNANLREPGASLEAYSLLVGDGDRHVDCAQVVSHDAPATRSRQTARSIAAGKSRAIFNSKVVVAAGAAGADSQQSLRGMLLSPSAEIDSRPQLEIHCDEVKCAHGATTGRLDPDMFFYLLSRGIDRDSAQSLLVFAFLADALTGMSLQFVRTEIERALIDQLPGTELLSKFR